MGIDLQFCFGFDEGCYCEKCEALYDKVDAAIADMLEEPEDTPSLDKDTFIGNYDPEWK